MVVFTNLQKVITKDTLSESTHTPGQQTQKIIAVSLKMHYEFLTHKFILIFRFTQEIFIEDLQHTRH